MSRVEFRLPDVGEGLSGGEIVRWLVGVGDTVRRDQPLVEIETDKSLVELPAPEDGVILELMGSEGDVLPVGDLLLVLETSSAPKIDIPTGGVPSAEGSATPAENERREPIAAIPAHAVATSGSRAKAAPTVRKLAVELEVDLSQLEGTGAGGKITKEDVLGAAAGQKNTSSQRHEAAGGSASHTSPVQPRVSGVDRVEPLRGLRRQIAKTMTTAWQQVPHITDIREVDATAIVAARKRLALAYGTEVERLTYLPLLVRAVTETLRDSPKFNASVDMDAETITYHGRMNIGLAAATPDGLLVPVLHDADKLGIAQIANRIAQLAEGARQRTLTPQEMRDGTCTITNFGSFGGWIATPIIRPPESAIVGFGRIRDRVLAVDGEVVIRPTLTLCVSADHRLIDGDDMGAFLNRLTEFIESPILMIDGGR